MKKLLILAALALSIAAHAQKKDLPKQPVTDTAKSQVDTLFVFTLRDVQVLDNLLMSSVLQMNGKPLTGKEIEEMRSWISSKGRLIPKTGRP